VRLFDHLFVSQSGDATSFAADLNPKSLEIVTGAMIEPAIVAGNEPGPIQFERLGYFVRDLASTPGRPVYNRTVGLRDSFAKVLGGKGKTGRDL
jgi:glutaminyl-tRNA synthetase